MRQLLVVTALLLLLALRAASLIPNECVRNVSLGIGVCCPSPPDSPAPCGGDSRGRCSELGHSAVGVGGQRPASVLRRGCVCQPRFWGPACGDCFFGWEGATCNRRSRRVRRNIFSFDRRRRRHFVRLVASLPTLQSGFSVPESPGANGSARLVRASVQQLLEFANAVAAEPAPGTSCRGPSANSGGPGFLTWHRFALLVAERALQHEAASQMAWRDFALPYWDWAGASWCEVCVNELLGDPGNCAVGGRRRHLHANSEFFRWRPVCLPGRCRRCRHREQPPTLSRSFADWRFPSVAEVRDALLKSVFHGGFADVAERRLHAGLRASFGGEFAKAASAAADPLFLLHHAQMDRILQAWFLRNLPTVLELPAAHPVPGHSRNDNLVGFYPLIPHRHLFCRTEALGYEYDSLVFGTEPRRASRPRLEHFTTCRSVPSAARMLM